jgi:hypothetical protein
LVKWFARGVIVLFAVALGWMLLSPPTVPISTGTVKGSVNETLVCEALVFGETDLSPVTGAIDLERKKIFEDYLVDLGFASDSGGIEAGQLNQAADAVQPLCETSRENRQTLIIATSVVFLTLFVWWRTRRQTPGAVVSAPSPSTNPSEES